MRLHGLLGDYEPGRYLRVGQPLGHQPQDLRLARGERGQRDRGRSARLAPQTGEFADQAAGDGRREQRLATRDDPYRVEQPLRGDVFEQELSITPVCAGQSGFSHSVSTNLPTELLIDHR